MYHLDIICQLQQRDLFDKPFRNSSLGGLVSIRRSISPVSISIVSIIIVGVSIFRIIIVGVIEVRLLPPLTRAFK